MKLYDNFLANQAPIKKHLISPEVGTIEFVNYSKNVTIFDLKIFEDIPVDAELLAIQTLSKYFNFYEEFETTTINTESITNIPHLLDDLIEKYSDEWYAMLIYHDNSTIYLKLAR